MSRPRGYRLNTPALEGLLMARAQSKTELCRAADVRLSFLSDLTVWRYGASAGTARALADALGVAPGALFPELVGFVVPVEAA